MSEKEPKPCPSKRFSDFRDGGASWHSPDGMFEHGVDQSETGDTPFPPADEVFGIRDSDSKKGLTKQY